jgi:hypothetical protein
MGTQGTNASGQNIEPQYQINTLSQYNLRRKIQLQEMLRAMPGMRIVCDSDALHDPGGLLQMRPMPGGPSF